MSNQTRIAKLLHGLNKQPRQQHRARSRATPNENTEMLHTPREKFVGGSLKANRMSQALLEKTNVSTTQNQCTQE